MEVIDWSDRSVVACPSLKEVEMQEDPKEMTTDRAWDYSEEMARRLQQVSECYLVQQTVLPTSEAEIQHFALIQDCVQKLLQPEAYSHSHEAREEEVIDCWDATPSSFGSSWELELQEMLKERGVEIDIADVEEDEARNMYLLLKENCSQKVQCDAFLTSAEASTCIYRQTLQDNAALEEERDLLMKDIEPVAAIHEEEVIDCWDESQSPLDSCWERELQEMLKERGVEAEVADMEEDEAQELYALLKQNSSQKTQRDALLTSGEASTCNYRQTLHDIADLEEERNLLVKDIEMSIPMPIPASGIESPEQTLLSESKAGTQLLASIQDDDRMPIAASGDNCPEMTPECETPLADTCAHFKSNLQNLKHFDMEEPWSSDDEGSTVASSGPTDVNTLCSQSTADKSDLDDKLEHHVGVSCTRGEKEALRYSFFARAPSL